MCQNRLKRDKKKLKDAEANVSKALRMIQSLIPCT